MGNLAGWKPGTQKGERSSLFRVPVKSHREEPGRTRNTLGTHGIHGRTDHTDEPHNHPNPPTHVTPARPRVDHATAETAAEHSTTGYNRSTAGPEPTAPRGRGLRRGRPQRTRPSLHPLPDSSQSASLRLLEGGRRNEGARGPHYASSCARTPKSGQLVPAQRPTDGDACCARGRQIC